MAINKGHEKLIPGKSIIIRDQLKDNAFMLFESCTEFYEHYPKESHHLVHEYILSWQKQKPKFDIDKCSDDIIEDIVGEIILTFEEVYGFQPDIVICDSSNEAIKSVHVIITDCCFLNTREADWFTREVLFNKLPDDQKPYLDIGVNKPNQSFRTPFSTKDGRTKIPKDNSRHKTMVTLVDDCQVLPEKAPPNNINKFDFKTDFQTTLNVDLNQYIDSSVWLLKKQPLWHLSARTWTREYVCLCFWEQNSAILSKRSQTIQSIIW